MDPLFDLLDAFHELCRYHGDALTASPYEHERWRQVRDGLTDRFLDENPVTAAAGSWDAFRVETPSDAPGRDLLVHLWVVLDALDRHFASQPLQAVRRDRSVHLIGERWWTTLSGSVVRPLASHEHFPHLTRGHIRDEEWTDDTTVADRFQEVAWGDDLCVGLYTLDGYEGHATTQCVGTRPLDSERGVYGFRAEAVTGRRDPADELRAAVAWARDAGVHILLFPELAIDERGRDALREEIGRDPGQLRLVVPGSFHVSTGSDDAPWANTAPVWLVSASGIVAALGTDARKREPFEMPALPPPDASPPTLQAHQSAWDDDTATFQTLREDIGGRGHVPFVATPLGVLSVLICRDALPAPGTAPDADLPYRALRAADHLAFLAMNGSASAWFWERGEEASRQFFSGCYFVNAAQAVREDDQSTPVAFWLLPDIREAIQSDPDLSKPSPRHSHRALFYRTPPPPDTAPHRRVAPWPVSGGLFVRIPLAASSPFTDRL